MPGDWGISSYLQENYQQFMDGLNTLVTGGTMTQREAEQRAARDSQVTNIIQAPGTDDVFQIGPRPGVASDQWAEHFRAQAEGRSSNNSLSVEAEIGRRLGVMDRIAHSAQDEEAKAFGQMLTAIDNVQDLLAVTSVVGRLALSPLGTLIPGVGIPIAVVAGAADLLRMLGWLGLIAAPAYAALCQGTPLAAVAGVPAIAFGRGLKNKFSAAKGLSPFGMAGRIKAGWRTAGQLGKLPNRYNLIEGVQVSRDFVGYGMAFGGIVGLMVDAAWGAARALSGRPSQLFTPRDPMLYYEGLRDLVDATPDFRVEDIRTAAGVLSKAWMVLGARGLFDRTEQINNAAMWWSAWDWVRPVVEHPRFQELALAAEDDSWTPAGYAYRSDVAELTPYVLGIAASTRLWPLEGSPRAVTGLELMRQAKVKAQAGLDYVLETWGEEWMGWGILAFMRQGAERAWLADFQDPDAIAWELTPADALCESLALASLIVNLGESHDAIQEWGAACYLWMDTHGRRQVPREVLLSLADRYGLHLVPLLPVGYPIQTPQP